MRFPAFLLAVLLPFLAKAEVGITVITSQDGSEVTADFLAYNFNDIYSMQLAITWDPQVLDFQTATNIDLVSSNNFAYNQPEDNEGVLIISWFAENFNGVTIPDCNNIFSLKFTALSPQSTPIVIQDLPGIPIEITDNTFSNVPLIQNLGCSDLGQIQGHVFYDENMDCVFGSGEANSVGWNVKIEQGGSTYFRTTDPNGDYHFYGLPGSYQVSILSPVGNLWSACQPSQTVDIIEAQATILDFAAQALVDCEQLNVDLAAPFLRRCFESTYHVQYCNSGTLDASNAYVELSLDPFLSYVSSSIPFSTADGQTFTFPIGDVPVGDCGSFSVTVLVSCDAVFGQTHCSEARIFPSEICQPTNPQWDGSILKVKGVCDVDSVRFSVANSGEAMPFPVDFIVIEDDMVNFEGAPIQLGAGESTTISVPANGSTWRMELDNEASSPFNASTASSLEGCGVNGSGSFSLGFVTQFPLDDNTPFTDVDCQANVDSYDPNDKTGYPNGFCAAHFIEAGQDIEYRIRFQNTGTAPAINIVVQDTLPLTLDPSTVQPGASSHPYSFELLGNGVLRFTFTDIMLPDSNASEPDSHGFVNFTVAQASSNTNGTLINNQAAIYFDFNAPVFTNTYSHTVADDFVQSAGTDGNLSLSGHVLTWYGAPVEDVEVTLVPTCPVNTDSDGYFEFLQLDTADYVLIASKPNLDKQDGVTVLDLIKARRYMMGLDTFQFLEQQIAGDVNNSVGFTTLDLVELPKFILNQPVSDFSNNWKFGIENNHFNDLSENVDNVQIKAIKPGNILDESMVDSSAINPHFYFVANPAVNGKMVVEMKVDGLEQYAGLQMGLQWDPNIMQFYGTDTAYVIGENNSQPGKLQFFHLGDGESYPDSATILKFIFLTNAPQGTPTELALDTSLINFQVIVEECNLTGASLETGNFQIEIGTAVGEPRKSEPPFILSPNPVKAGQPVFVQLSDPAINILQFQLFDAKGQLIRQWNSKQDHGHTHFTIESPLVKGLYLLKAAHAKGGGTVKFVVY